MYHEMKSLKFIEMKNTHKNKSIMIKKWLKENKLTEYKKMKTAAKTNVISINSFIAIITSSDDTFSNQGTKHSKNQGTSMFHTFSK